VSIASTNYETFQAKAKMAEAKLALSAIFSLEKTFYSEYSAYIAGFDAIGYTPEGNKRHYALGWSAASNAGTISGYPNSGGTFFISRVNVPIYSCGNPAATNFAAAEPAATTTDPQTFLVFAMGGIRPNGGCNLCSITHLKTIACSVP
jgi:hypothetical protein